MITRIRAKFKIWQSFLCVKCTFSTNIHSSIDVIDSTLSGFTQPNAIISINASASKWGDQVATSSGHPRFQGSDDRRRVADETEQSANSETEWSFESVGPWCWMKLWNIWNWVKLWKCWCCTCHRWESVPSTASGSFLHHSLVWDPVEAEYYL